MLIGSKDLRSVYRNLNDLEGYCKSLLPLELRENEQILNNQKYYVALYIRKNAKMEYEKRKTLTENLLRGVYVTGDMTQIIEFSELENHLDYNKLVYNIYKRRKENVSGNGTTVTN